MNPHLTPDALAAYTARYRETHTDEPLLHEPSMRAVVEMVLEKAAIEAGAALMQFRKVHGRKYYAGYNEDMKFYVTNRIDDLSKPPPMTAQIPEIDLDALKDGGE